MMNKTRNASETRKTEEQIVSELAEARRRIAELEASATEGDLAMEALRVSEERYRSVVENIGIGLTLIDRDHRIAMANAMQGQIFHKAASKLVGRKCFEEFEKRDAVCPHCPGVQAMATGRPAMVETTGIRDNGSVNFARIKAFPVLDAQGTPTGFIEVVEDITELKQAEEAQQESEERFRLLVEYAADAFFLHDSDSSILDVNRRACESLGYTREELLSLSIQDFDPAFDLGELEQWEQMVPGEPVTFERVHIRNDGTTFPVEVRLGVFKSGERRLFLALVRDITERKRAEEALKEYSEHLEEMVEERTKELRDAQEQLIRKERLAVLGQMAGGVGHELRNPLGAISNAAYFLSMVLEEPEPEVKETLEILQKEVKTSEMIISSLLDFARAKPPTRRKVDINDVVQETLSRATVPENVEVVSQLDETLPIILADPDQLGQVFENIILNAIQAMPEGGQLVVKTSEVSEKLPKSEWVAISFADTGMGISQENLNKLFEPLFTTKAKGVGLGLAVVKSLVDGHGGTIEIQSKVGKGSTFTVRLPTKEAQAQQRKSADHVGETK
jgi:PAS domain S-box-containing protein